MSLFNMPQFVLIPVSFELVWVLFWFGVAPVYRRLARRQAVVAETRGNPPPEFVASPRWLRVLEILFAATHIIPLALLASIGRDNTISTTVALIVNGLLLSAILYFVL